MVDFRHGGGVREAVMCCFVEFGNSPWFDTLMQ